ncbi:murein biosynthesis integral membrane protein MurJ [soil metagenome]
MTIATAASRVTGFIRVVVVAAAMGTTFLANTYQTANTAPNVVFELLAAGVLTSIFVPTFVEYLVKGDDDEGWRVANILGSVALAALTALALLLAVAAPLVMRLLTLGVQDGELRAREVALGSTWLRLFAPQVVFYGASMIMTGALHAHRRFGLAAAAPIFNNVVVIGVYLAYALMRGDRPPRLSGITPAETFVLGAGTTAGVVAMTAALIPQLRGLGWRFRWRFLPRHDSVKRAARLGVWALGYAGGYQAGLVVVLVLANRIEGGVAAYQWAYTFFFVPHALFAVPVFNVLFPAMSEHVARRQLSAFSGRLRDGLGMLSFILVPVAIFMVIAAEPIARVTLQYGVMSGAGTALVGRVLAAFAIGLPMYSAFLALTRAAYALGDTRSPALVNAAAVIASSAAGVVLFLALPAGWAVAGLALGHTIGFSLGAVVLARVLARKVGSTRPVAHTATIARSLAVAVAATAAMLAVHAALPITTKLQSLSNLTGTGVAGAVVYLALMSKASSPEMTRLTALLSRARA